MENEMKKIETNIENNTLIGCQMSELSSDILANISKAILNITELFVNQRVYIDAFIKVEQKQPVNGEKEEEGAE